jgi:DNA (cytosine-5)-methyltransferase 1
MDTKNIQQNTSSNIDWNGTPWTDRTFSHPERTITILTSCSGIGAPEQSLELLGLKTKILGAGDIDANVKKSYFENYDIREEQWHNDMFKLNATPFKGKTSLFFAGICCQTFSRAGKCAGTSDETRGQLFKAFTRIVRECEPKIFLLENVDNMLTLHNGEDWKEIKSALDELGYDIYYQVLNGTDYGIPQNRPRLFVIGFREKTDFLFPRPIPLTRNIRDFLDDKTPGVRQLTMREALRFQGFPESFKISKNVSKTYIYKQAGNSICVDVLKAIWRQMDITKYGFNN